MFCCPWGVGCQKFNQYIHMLCSGRFILVESVSSRPYSIIWICVCHKKASQLEPSYLNMRMLKKSFRFRELEGLNELTDHLQNQFSSGAYTHHQKSVICDAPGQHLVAFVGGLDLTGGRYDTPDHELFKTLLTEHNGDFRNSDSKGISPMQGPREPWHDIHSKAFLLRSYS